MAVNTAALKTFAPAMRRQLMEAVGRKLDLLLNSQTPDTLSTYAKQIAELRNEQEKSREQLLERVAYTWFNRLCALRYLDAKGWHPFGCKVLMPADGSETQPELLKLMRSGSLPADLKTFTNEQRLNQLLDGQIPTAIPGGDAQGEVYRELVLAACRSYHNLLPELFEETNDSSELLLPEDLLDENSVAKNIQKGITDADCAEVEILGWLFQFYNSELKAEATSLKKLENAKQIGPATQVFTPSWITKYLVCSALGSRTKAPNHGPEELDTFLYKLNPSNDTQPCNPEELLILDPACGSGHLLIETFRQLARLYEENGYSRREIPSLILQKNIRGFDICERASQITKLSLTLLTREYSRSAFSQYQRPKIYTPKHFELEESLLEVYELELRGKLAYSIEVAKRINTRRMTQTGFLEKTSIKCEEIERARNLLVEETINLSAISRMAIKKLIKTLDAATLLTSKYDVIISNPPYMGSRQMPSMLSDYIKEEYELSKGNLANCFIERCSQLLSASGVMSMVTPEAWMFTGTFEGFRKWLINSQQLSSMIHIGSGGFDDGFGTTAFTLKNKQKANNANTLFIDLRSHEGAQHKILAMKSERTIKTVNQDIFLKLPGVSLAYWASNAAIEALEKATPLEAFSSPRQGMATGDNEKYLRFWHEVEFSNIEINAGSLQEWENQNRRWAPYSKGGTPRKWYGNAEHVIAFSPKDYEELAQQGNRLPARQHYFKEAINWSLIGGSFAARLRPKGFVFDVNGMSSFDTENPVNLLSLVNSAVGSFFLGIINPTLAFQVGDLKKFPCLDVNKVDCSNLSKDAITLAKRQWDSNETSWDFKYLEIASLQPNSLDLKNKVKSKLQHDQKDKITLMAIEKDIDQRWADHYCIGNDLKTYKKQDSVDIFESSTYIEITKFISYATGCIMGRYSLDHPGLILADSLSNQGEQLAAYEAKIGKSINDIQFKPDADAIIPVLDGEWFEDDIVARTREFLKVTFPESSVAENLRFIEDSIGKDIRKYFCKDFYKDHLQTYKKRPIYWMVQSPKAGFACLIYLHRYTPDTLLQVLNNYFRPYLQKLEARQEQLERDQNNDALPKREQTAARKEAEKITKVLKECQAWEQDALLPLAQQRIELDLDDGVKVNYLKLKDVLQKIPGLAAKGD